MMEMENQSNSNMIECIINSGEVPSVLILSIVNCSGSSPHPTSPPMSKKIVGA